jgi:hypothetical protein
VIHDNDGRRVSVRTEDEEVELLREQLEALDPDERAALEALLVDSGHEGGIYETASSIIYDHEPVSVEQFLMDPYYLGATGKTLYPKLKDDLVELFEGGDYNEAVFSGSIGFGKSTVCEFALARMIYEMLCLKDPQTTYGLTPGSQIVVAIISVNIPQVRATVLSNLIAKFQLSPFFEQAIKPTYRRGGIEFPKNIHVVTGSPNAKSLIGMNVFGGLMDEGNFLETVKLEVDEYGRPISRAQKLHDNIIRRMKSRYMRVGRIPGVMLVASSKGSTEDFTEHRIAAALHDPSIMVREYATWDVAPAERFSDEKFHVLVGDEYADSRILEGAEVSEWQKFLAENPERTAKIIPVPIDYYNDFDRDLVGSIRDIAGVATLAITPFITQRQRIEESIEDRHHPFSTQVLEMGGPGDFLWDELCKRGVRKIRGGFEEEVWTPLRNPKAPRHIHIDPSLTGDATGICMAHIGRWKDVVRRDPNGREYTELAPEIVVDFILRITPPRNGEILLGDVRSLIYQLAAHGFHVAKVTTDSFQSAETIQKLKQRGIRAELLSVDTKTAPYDSLKAALYERRLLMYRYQPLIDELVQLEKTKKGKVDHPPRGSKDVSDALAGVCFSLSSKPAQRPIGMMAGAQDNYPLEEDNSWVLPSGLQPVDPPPEPPKLRRPSQQGPGRGMMPPTPFVGGGFDPYGGR